MEISDKHYLEAVQRKVRTLEDLFIDESLTLFRRKSGLRFKENGSEVIVSFDGMRSVSLIERSFIGPVSPSLVRQSHAFYKGITSNPILSIDSFESDGLVWSCFVPKTQEALNSLDQAIEAKIVDDCANRISVEQRAAVSDIFTKIEPRRHRAVLGMLKEKVVQELDEASILCMG